VAIDQARARVALRRNTPRARAVIATITLANAMVDYNAVSTRVIAEPMVKFDRGRPVISRLIMKFFNASMAGWGVVRPLSFSHPAGLPSSSRGYGREGGPGALPHSPSSLLGEGRATGAVNGGPEGAGGGARKFDGKSLRMHAPRPRLRVTQKRHGASRQAVAGYPPPGGGRNHHNPITEEKS